MRPLTRGVIGAAISTVVASCVAMVVSLLGPSPRSQVRETIIYLLITAMVCAAIATFALALRYSLHRPGIELDASGRWVTLHGVHRNFADAVVVRSASTSTAARDRV